MTTLKTSRGTPTYLLTRAQAASALGITERSLYDVTKRGELRCVRLGRRVMYRPQDVQALVEWLYGESMTA